MTNMKKQSVLLAFFCVFMATIAIAQEIKAKNESDRIPGVAGFATNYENHKIPVTRGEGTPSSYSLKKFVPPVGDQGDKGTCVGWATTYAGMTILENITLKREGKKVNRQDCFSPQMTYDICREENDTACSEGTYVKAALNALTMVGATTLAEYPYRCNVFQKDRIGVQRLYNDNTDVNAVADFLKKARTKRLEGFIPIGGANVIENVKYYLSRNMPVVITVEMYNSIQTNSVSGVWNGVMDYYPGGHAMCVIGYDDAKEGGSFEIVNSWGDDWSKGGFVWFRYNDFAKVVDEAYALKGIKSEAETNIQVHNYDFYITAIGKKSSKTLEIASQERWQSDMDLKVGGLSNDLIIKYPSSENECILSIKNLLPDGFFAYAFSICCGGKVSMISPSKGSSDFYQGENSGLMIPSDQFTGIPLAGGYYEGDEICVLLTKKELNQEVIGNSLLKNYNSLKQYINFNFSDRITLNNPSFRTYSSGKLHLENSLEVNDVQPLFFKYQAIVEEEKEKKKETKETEALFKEIKIDSRSYISTYQLRYKFRRDLLDPEFNLKIAVKRNWLKLGFSYKVHLVLMNKDTETEYKLNFNGTRYNKEERIIGEIVNCLISNSVPFSIE